MPIPDIIDNSTPEKKLGNVLNEVITPGVNVYIASGYFNLGGFKLISDHSLLPNFKWSSRAKRN